MSRFRAGANKKDILALLATALTYTSSYSGHSSTDVTVLQRNYVLVFMLYCPLYMYMEVSEICCGNRDLLHLFMMQTTGFPHLHSVQ